MHHIDCSKSLVGCGVTVNNSATEESCQKLKENKRTKACLKESRKNGKHIAIYHVQSFSCPDISE